MLVRGTALVCSARDKREHEQESNAVLTDHQHKPDNDGANTEEALGRLITSRPREAQTRRSGDHGKSHCGARSQQLAPVVRAPRLVVVSVRQEMAT